MTLAQLYKKLDMEDPSELEYFEQFADLMEMDEDIPFDLFYMALSGAEAETAGDLVENYFEDLTNAAPDEENELVSIIDSVEQNLLLLAPDISNDEVRRDFAQQLYKFRCWYKKEGSVSIDGQPASVFEAVLSFREGKIGGQIRSLDFSGSLDYELDDVSYGIGGYQKIDVVKTEEDEERTESSED